MDEKTGWKCRGSSGKVVGREVKRRGEKRRQERREMSRHREEKRNTVHGINIA